MKSWTGQNSQRASTGGGQMRTMELFDAGELTEEDLRAVFQSRGFQQILFYQQLASGVEILQNNEVLLDGIVANLTKEHSQIESEEITREFLTILCREITTPLEPVDNDVSNKIQQQLFDFRQPAKETSASPDEAESTVKEFLNSQLEDVDEVELKAKDIAAETGLKSTHVGSILGRWRQSDDAPFVVSASEYAGRGNTWEIGLV